MLAQALLAYPASHLLTGVIAFNAAKEGGVIILRLQQRAASEAPRCMKMLQRYAAMRDICDAHRQCLLDPGRAGE
jgi:hypothetical protein